MIEVKECSKAFGTVKAVNKATLDVEGTISEGISI